VKFAAESESSQDRRLQPAEVLSNHALPDKSGVPVSRRRLIHRCRNQAHCQEFGRRALRKTRLASRGKIRHPPATFEAMTLKLSTLSILLGLGLAAPQIYGLMKPAAFAAAARKFPRSVPIGVLLMLLGTAWFLWNLNGESISDFAALKPYLMFLFAAVGIGSCIFLQDFLAVRGLGVVLLLLGKLMVDTGRPRLEDTHWVLVIQAWAYVLVLAGMWFTISPWRLRDLLNWATANEQRVRLGSAARLAFALFVLVLGLTVF
jgi:predicted DNA-binding transcriptional regulator AlpA